MPIDDPDLPLRLLFDRWPETAAVFLSHRMYCLGCPIAPFHTVIDACAEYRLDEASFRVELRATVAPAPEQAFASGRKPAGQAALVKDDGTGVRCVHYLFGHRRLDDIGRGGNQLTAKLPTKPT